MPGFKKGQKQGTAKKDWTADSLTEEINKLNLADYEEVINYLLCLEVNKIKYLAEQATRIPLIVKAIAVAINTDLNNGRGTMLSDMLNRVMARKMPLQVEPVIDQPIKIEVASPDDKDELDKL